MVQSLGACDREAGVTKGSTHAQRGKSLVERFNEKVERTEGCWLWQSAIGSRGYGIFWVGGERRSAFAHRIAYEIAHPDEPMPAGLLVMHSCDNPRCVNPAHLSLGTNSQNQLDSSRKGRNARGEKNGGGRRLTEIAVREILATHGQLGCRRAARAYGVSSQTIKAIRRGRSWAYVAREERQNRNG